MFRRFTSRSFSSLMPPDKSLQCFASCYNTSLARAAHSSSFYRIDMDDKTSPVGFIVLAFRWLTRGFFPLMPPKGSVNWRSASFQTRSRRSDLLTASRSNVSGSKLPPIQVNISSCSLWAGFMIASRKS